MSKLKKNASEKKTTGALQLPEMKDFPTIRQGDHGGYVTAAQANLQARGYDIGKAGINGKFGADLLKAVKAFQKDIGQPIQNGVVGPKTWEAMQSFPIPKAAEEKKHAEVIPDTAAKEPESENSTDYRVIIEHLTRYQAEMLIRLFEGGIQCRVI